MKKTYVSAIAALLAFSVAGCGSTAPSEGTVNTPAAGSKEPSAPPAAEAAKPTLKILANYQANIDPNKDVMVADLEKATGYKAEFFMLPQQKPEEKLNIEIASGADYDILKLTPSQFYTLAAQGALLPLDDLLDKHGANVKNALLPESWELSRLNGAIFGIPQKNERPQIGSLLQLRRDILDGLNLPMPQTADDFYNVLKAVKEKHKDMIPYSGSISDASGMVNATIGSAFGLYTDWIDVDGALVPRIQMPQMKQYLAFMVKLYQEGLLDPDWAINKTSSTEEKFVSGKAFMIQSGYTPSTRIVPAVNKNIPGAKLTFVQPLQDKNGNAGIRADYKLNYVTAIPKSAKHPEDAMKYLDLKLKPENFEFLALGPRGVTFNLEDGKYIPIMPVFTEQRNNGFWYLNGLDERKYPDMWLARLRRDANLFASFEELNQNPKVYKTDPTALMPPLAEVSKNVQALTKMEQDYFIKLLMGEEKLDNYDKFIAQWNNAGGTDMTKAVNDWYKTKTAKK